MTTMPRGRHAHGLILITLEGSPTLPSQRPSLVADSSPLRVARECEVSPAEALMDLVHRVGQCHRLLRQVLNDSLASEEINDTAFLAMWLCASADSPGISQSELTAATGTSAAQMSGLLDRLRRHGWMTSVRLEGDRRRQWWRLTPAGQQICASIGQSLQSALINAFGPLSCLERQQLHTLLDRMILQQDSTRESKSQSELRWKTFPPVDAASREECRNQGGGQ